MMTQKEKEKESQTNSGKVEEKRIKPSVIRRRAAPKAPEPPPELVVEKPVEVVAQAPAPPPPVVEAPPVVIEQERAPVRAQPSAPSAPASRPAAEPKDDRKPLKRGGIKSKADEKREALRKAAATKKVKEKSAADILLELKVEEEE